MTFNVGRVSGGSHAGWKRQKPKPVAWECRCKHVSDTPWVRPDGWWNATVAIGKVVDADEPDAHGVRIQPAYMSRCPDCKTERP